MTANVGAGARGRGIPGTLWRVMASLRFVHAADLHLDSPFVGIRASAPEHVAGALREATFDAYEKVIDLCIDERVDALLVAGDVYDGADRSLRAQQAFIRGLRRLDEAGIRSFVCHGNHDPLDGWEARLAYPESCHRFGPEWEAAPVFESDPGRGLVYGVSYPTRDVYHNLVNELGSVDAGPFNIGLVHANVGSNTGHEAYAPCTLDDLRGIGIDYWALGHVHTREVMRDRGPAVVYPGNPQGRHVNETGARGVYVVEVDGGDARPEFRAMDTVRWARIEADVSGLETDQELHDRLFEQVEEARAGADGRPIVMRVELTGRTALHGTLRRSEYLEDLRESILNAEFAGQSPFAWCERIEDETASPIDRDALLKGSDFLAEVLLTGERARQDGDGLARFRARLADLYRHHRYRRYLDADGPADEEMQTLMDRAESLAVELLAEGRP